MSIEVRGVLTLLQVFDMPASVRFYRDVLGFEVIQTTMPRETADRAVGFEAVLPARSGWLHIVFSVAG